MVVTGKKEIEFDILVPSRIVAQWLGVHLSTVRRLIARREIIAYKVGGLIRVSSSSVQAYLDSSRLDDAEDNDEE